MKHPAYNLRPNKAIDRFLFIEAIQRLSNLFPPLKSYTYHSLAGPFLDDCRLVTQYFPDLKQVSIEKNSHTHKRQNFHSPTKRIKLYLGDVGSYLATFPGEGKHIFWLDYTNLKYSCFDEYMTVLDKVEDGSMIKITLRAEISDNPFIGSFPQTETWVQDRKKAYLEEFKNQYGKVLPEKLDDSDFIDTKFVDLIQKMLQIAAQKALPASAGRTFQIIDSCFYNDQTLMLSLTGIVCSNEQRTIIFREFKKWKEANLEWMPAKRIDVPNLSLKERFKLDRHLPRVKAGARSLSKSLGYNIDSNSSNSERKLEQYSNYYRYYPLFAKVSV